MDYLSYTTVCTLLRDRLPGSLEDFLFAFGIRERYNRDIVMAWIG